MEHLLANPMELLSEHKQSSKLVALTPLIGISVIGDHPKIGMETHEEKNHPALGVSCYVLSPFPSYSFIIVTYLTYLKIAEIFVIRG